MNDDVRDVGEDTNACVVDIAAAMRRNDVRPGDRRRGSPCLHEVPVLLSTSVIRKSAKLLAHSNPSFPACCVPPPT